MEQITLELVLMTIPTGLILFLLHKLRKVKETVSSDIESRLVKEKEEFISFYNTEKADLATNLPKLIHDNMKATISGTVGNMVKEGSKAAIASTPAGGIAEMLPTKLKRLVNANPEIANSFLSGMMNGGINIGGSSPTQKNNNIGKFLPLK